MTITDKIQKIVKIMPMSSMEDNERKTWLTMLPLMNESEIDKLLNSLDKEIQALNDLYLTTLK